MTRSGTDIPTSRWQTRISAALIATAVFWLVLALPISAGDLGLGLLKTVPPELPLIVLALIACGRGLAGLLMRVMVTTVLVFAAILKLADIGMAEVLGRPFNPVGDLALIDASARMITGSFGPLVGIATALAALTTILALAWLLWWASGVWSGIAGAHLPFRIAAGVFGAIVAGVMIWLPAGQSSDWPIRAKTLEFIAAKGVLSRRTLIDLREFRQSARTDTMVDQPGSLAVIGRDVLLIFVESYGRTSFDTPYYADTHLSTLKSAQDRLTKAGLAMRSGFLTAPTQGGQSWLSHASLASGLWIDDQSRYRAYLASGRHTLFHNAQTAGFRTAAVMPAITRPWPEAARMGFDQVLTSDSLGYRGKPFNWVTMPDQFTLAATDRLLRGNGDSRHLFAQIALISSHAPWVPVPQMVPWDQIEDGTIFDTMAEAGPTPKEVWADRDRVRAQYRLAIDYTLQVVTDYALRHASDPPLMIVLGDHQAAARIALDSRRAVPIHVIGPADLVDRSMNWGLTPGLIPTADALAIPMQDMRDLILNSFRQAPQTADVRDGD